MASGLKASSGQQASISHKSILKRQTALLGIMAGHTLRLGRGSELVSHDLGGALRVGSQMGICPRVIHSWSLGQEQGHSRCHLQPIRGLCQCKGNIVRNASEEATIFHILPLGKSNGLSQEGDSEWKTTRPREPCQALPWVKEDGEEGIQTPVPLFCRSDV